MAQETPTSSNQHPEGATPGENLSAAASHVEAGARQALSESGLDREGPSLATATLVGVGLAIVEPELIPGMLIGAGALLAPKVLPGLGNMLRPLVKGVVKAGYSAAMTVREVAAEAGENVQDMVAEARAEYESSNGHATPAQAEPAEEHETRQRRARRPAPATNL